jgi:hypothetical protein
VKPDAVRCWTSRSPVIRAISSSPGGRAFALESQRERQGKGDFVRSGGTEVGSVGQGMNAQGAAGEWTPTTVLQKLIDIRGRSAEHRQRERQQRSRPLVEALQVWLREQLGRLSGRSKLAQAIRYAFNHWDGLIRFLDDGRLEMDTTSSNAPCAQSPSDAKTRCSPVPTAADAIGQSSRH